MFVAEKIIKKLRRNMAVYLVVVLELAFGTAFLTYAMNQFFSYRDNKQELEQVFPDEAVSLEISVREGKEAELISAPFDDSDYTVLKELTDGVTAYLCMPELLEMDGKVEEVIFVYTNIVEETGHAYCGENIRKQIRSGTVILDGMNGSYSKERIIYYGKEYKCEPMPEHIRDTIIARNMFEKRLYAGDCIFLPLKDCQDKISAPAQTIVQYRIEDIKKAAAINEKIVHYLTERHPQYVYKVSNNIDDYEQNNESTMEFVKYIAVLAIIAMWILAFGYMGITKQLFIKRQREFAVCLAAGATKRIIFLEMLIENAAILTVSTAAGNLMGIYMLDLQKNNIFTAQYHCETLLISVLLAIILLLCINLPILKKVQSLQPQVILTDL
ncbi:ABC transporter permease [Extibacter muris]|uniref:ABC transporter permease n=1 Tax=Extibacter muris TaxID=1796622 RepID=UPI001D08849D|nr:ABC transporter permease [Extibacter muris]MCB6202216.1 ABC transporter permease [Extibacter muris]MCQ4662651.1 ABC transporter permease [Extibacter muris]MCQ4693066.1 ABC transporter permease [Extibacter muris]